MLTALIWKHIQIWLRTVPADVLELMEEGNGTQRSYSILKTAQDMYNSVMNLL